MAVPHQLTSKRQPSTNGEPLGLSSPQAVFDAENIRSINAVQKDKEPVSPWVRRFQRVAFFRMRKANKKKK